MTVYLISKFDRWCPENDNGDYFIAAFSTKELAIAYKEKYDPKDKNGRKTNPDGLFIKEFELDVEK